MNARILVVSHGHPDLQKGGAEIASYNLFTELKSQGVDAHFLALTERMEHGGTLLSSINHSSEILIHDPVSNDRFLHSNIHSNLFNKTFCELIAQLKPDVIHFHHYLGFGIEIFRHVQTILPKARVVLTLHEYMAICHNNGLMVKTNDQLCFKASARECSSCFPDYSAADFFLRERYIKNMLTFVDRFIAPSQFLKQRYMDWGIEDKQCHVIENCLNSSNSKVLTKISKRQSKVNFVYFGQINPVKGIDILISSLKYLPKKLRNQFVINIYGANLDKQSKEFRAEFQRELAEFSSNLRFHGSYEQNMLYSLVAKSDWVVVPSTWWENSPMVIQEALHCGVPIIASDIGGMAEKVIHDQNGLLFSARNPADLANVMEHVITNRQIQERLSETVVARESNAIIVKKHMELYQ